MDFYFTNKLPSTIAIQPQGANNNTSNADQAEAVDPTFLTQTHYSQGRFAYTHGCYTHHKHLS